MRKKYLHRIQQAGEEPQRIHRRHHGVSAVMLVFLLPYADASSVKLKALAVTSDSAATLGLRSASAQPCWPPNRETLQRPLLLELLRWSLEGRLLFFQLTFR